MHGGQTDRTGPWRGPPTWRTGSGMRNLQQLRVRRTATSRLTLWPTETYKGLVLCSWLLRAWDEEREVRTLGTGSVGWRADWGGGRVPLGHLPVACLRDRVGQWAEAPFSVAQGGEERRAQGTPPTGRVGGGGEQGWGLVLWAHTGNADPGLKGLPH